MTATEPLERELNYPGKADPPQGSVMGPGLDRRFWLVAAVIHDGETSTLSLREIPRNAAEPVERPAAVSLIAGAAEVADLLYRKRRPQPREST
jgi:hypothetical protein